jgi:hypothetical protein
MVLLVISSVVVLWAKNRDILRDSYDYSVVIAAAGKVEQGFKPYADVRSPMQSSVYLLNYSTERLFGRNYLGLTVGGLVQGLLGGLLLLGLLRNSLGVWLAGGLTMAVVLAGLMQHMVFFYNTVGIWCLSIVLLGLAVEPALWPVRSLRTTIILAALFLSGINKINFHGVTLVFAVLLTIASWRNGRIAMVAAGRNGLILVCFGGILPVGFELAWTGATYAQWLEQVVLGPTARHAFLAQIVSPDIYLSPAQDFYPHMLVRGIGGVGLGLLLLTGVWLLWDAWVGRRPMSEWLLRGGLILLGALASAALMITNHETVLLTSLAYPVIALVIYLQFSGSGRTAECWMRGILLGGMTVWVVAGGYAAWHGSRVLYGHNPPPRESYVRLDPQHRALQYFSGVRMPAEQIDAYERTATKLHEIEQSERSLQDVLFGAGQEWLERAYPQMIVRHAPIWLHAGTSLNDGDQHYMLEILDQGRRRLLVQKGWEAWPPEVSRMLEERYLAEDIGSRDRLYHPRGPRPPPTESGSPSGPAPLDFRVAVGSNVALAATRVSEGMTLQPGKEGMAYGAGRSTSWSWPLGSNALHGLAVARLGPAAVGTVIVTFRIMADDPERGSLIWQTSAAVGPDHVLTELPFSLYTGGRPLWLQTIVPPGLGEAVFAGWRQLRISHSNEQDHSPPQPFSAGLRRSVPAEGQDVGDVVRYVAVPLTSVGEDVMSVPAEYWRRVASRSGIVRVAFVLQRNTPRSGEPVNVTLAWYRAGRFEIMTERLIDAGNPGPVIMEAPVTEPGGWVGVLTRHGAAGDIVHISGWEN